MLYLLFLSRNQLVSYLLRFRMSIGYHSHSAAIPTPPVWASIRQKSSLIVIPMAQPLLRHFRQAVFPMVAVSILAGQLLLTEARTGHMVSCQESRTLLEDHSPAQATLLLPMMQHIKPGSSLRWASREAEITLRLRQYWSTFRRMEGKPGVNLSESSTVTAPISTKTGLSAIIAPPAHSTAIVMSSGTMILKVALS